MEQVSYSVGDLRRIIKESANEFNPKLGDSVMSDNKKNNDKSYKDAEKAVKDYDGGLKDPKKGELSDKTDYNRTTLDYNPVTEPDKEYKDKVNAQLKGYTSTAEMKNGIEKVGEFDDDGKLKKHFSDAADKANKEKEELAKSGLQGSKLDIQKKNTMYESKPSAKRLSFKHTTFLNEAQMLARIPEEYKADGQKIYMKDAKNNEYIVECVKNKAGNIETNVISYNNENVLNEQVNRINELFNYKSENEFAGQTYGEKIEESSSFKSMMDLARSLK